MSYIKRKLDGDYTATITSCPNCKDTGLIYTHDPDDEYYAVAVPCPFCDQHDFGDKSEVSYRPAQ